MVSTQGKCTRLEWTFEDGTKVIHRGANAEIANEEITKMFTFAAIHGIVYVGPEPEIEKGIEVKTQGNLGAEKNETN
jgi:hypothetical protein